MEVAAFIMFFSTRRLLVRVANTCKKMSYYLYLINYHHQQLPSHIFKMLVDTLVFLQSYALPIWGPTLGVDMTSQLQRLCNCAVWFMCGLKKYDHVLAAHHALGWLSFDSLVQHRTLNLMYRHLYVHSYIALCI